MKSCMVPKEINEKTYILSDIAVLEIRRKKWYDMMSGQTQVWSDMYVFCSDTIFFCRYDC